MEVDSAATADAADCTTKPAPRGAFELRTADVSALAALMYGMRDLTKTLAIRFAAGGLEVQERVCQDCVLLSVRLHAARFRTFHCPTPGGILLLPESLYTVLSVAGQRDEVALAYDAARSNLLRVTIYRDGEDDVDQSYEIRLLNYEPGAVYEAPTVEVDFLLAVDTAFLTSSFSRLIAFDASPFVDITCDKEKLQLEVRGEQVISRATVIVFTGPPEDRAAAAVRPRRRETQRAVFETEFARSVLQERVQHRVLLRHMQQLLKILGVNRGMSVLYLKRSYPIIIEVRVGALGDLRVTLLPVDV
jgi:hypothetical protein